jgi:hypothetical protein
MPSRNWAMLTENSSSAAGRTIAGLANEVAAAGTERPVTNGTTQTAGSNGTTKPPASAHTDNTKTSKRSGISSKSPRGPDGHSFLHAGETGAGTQHRAAGTGHGNMGDGGLDVMIRVEIDQHDKEGKTQGYGLTIPTLNASGAKSASNGAVPTEEVRNNGHIAGTSSEL